MQRLFALSLLILAMSCAAFGQDAKAIVLTEQEAIEAKSTYEAFKAAEKRWSELKVRLQRKYDPKLQFGETRFDKEFRVMVPAPWIHTGALTTVYTYPSILWTSPTTSCCGCCWSGWTGLTTTGTSTGIATVATGTALDLR